MEKVFVVEMVYFDETNGEVSVSTSVHSTEKSALDYLEGEVEHTLNVYEDIDVEVIRRSSYSVKVIWSQGYYYIDIVERIINK